MYIDITRNIIERRYTMNEDYDCWDPMYDEAVEASLVDYSPEAIDARLERE